MPGWTPPGSPAAHVTDVTHVALPGRLRRGEERSPDDPGGVPEGVAHDRGAELGVEDVTRHRLPAAAVERGQVREPATEHDHVRVEDADHVGERAPEVIEVARQHGTRDFLTRF